MAPARSALQFASALALAATLPACGAVQPAPAEANVQGQAQTLTADTCSIARDLIYIDEFENMGALATVGVPVAGHAFAALPPSGGEPSVLRSDPAGATVADSHARVETGKFSLVGYSRARVVLRTKFKLSGNDLFQVFATDGKKTILIGDLRTQNVDFPSFSEIVLNLSPFDGLDNVSLLIDRTTGPMSTPEYGVAIDSLKVTARPALSENVVFYDDFEEGLSQWRTEQGITVGPPAPDANHIWALKNGLLCDGLNEFRSDPIGATRPGVHNRAISKSFSLAGKCKAFLSFQDRHSLFGNDIYSVQVQDGVNTYLVGDYRGTNPGFPGYQDRLIDISPYVAGKPRVNLAITVITGNVGSGFGVGLDNVQVIASDCVD